MGALIDLTVQHVLRTAEIRTGFEDGKAYTPAQFKTKLMGLPAKYAGVAVKAMRSDFTAIELSVGKLKVGVQLSGTAIWLEWRPRKDVPLDDELFAELARTYGRVRAGLSKSEMPAVAFGGSSSDKPLCVWTQGSFGRVKSIRLHVVSPKWPREELSPIKKPAALGVSEATLQKVLLGKLPALAEWPGEVPKDATLFRNKSGEVVAIKTPVKKAKSR